MKLRKSVIVGLLVLFVSALLPVWIFREPSHEGRTLSSWLDDLNANSSPLAPADLEKAEAAIRAIGPRGVPYLVRMMNSSRHSNLQQIRLMLWEALFRRRESTTWELRSRGVAGLRILGPAAASAVPAIIGVLQGDPGRVELWSVLEGIGPASASAAPLFDQLLAKAGKDSDFDVFWMASGLFMSWGGPFRARLEVDLQNRSNSPPHRVSCVWALRKHPQPRALIPIFSRIIADPTEDPLLRKACLHGLGRIPAVDPVALSGVIASYEEQFGPLAEDAILNGDFTASEWVDESRPMPNDPQAPSVLIRHWLTWAGVLGRNLSPPPGPGPMKLELGPRAPPGSISQVFRTTPGVIYRVSFDAATGRNLRGHIAVGDLDKAFIPSGAATNPTKFQFEFRAQSSLATLTFGGVDYEGYGPFIDRVIVEKMAPVVGR